MATTMSDLVRGGGMFINFITVLTEELVKAAGFPEMIYFSQKEHARPMMELVAKTIVNSRLWKIPRSLIEKEILLTHPKQSDACYLEFDRRFSWAIHSETAKNLTTHFYSDDNEDAQMCIPETLREIMLSQKPQFPWVIEWKGKAYVVTKLFSSMEEENWTEDELEKPLTEISQVGLALADYFDLEN